MRCRHCGRYLAGCSCGAEARAARLALALADSREPTAPEPTPTKSATAPLTPAEFDAFVKAAFDPADLYASGVILFEDPS